MCRDLASPWLIKARLLPTARSPIFSLDLALPGSVAATRVDHDDVNGGRADQLINNLQRHLARIRLG